MGLKNTVLYRRVFLLFFAFGGWSVAPASAGVSATASDGTVGVNRVWVDHIKTVQLHPAQQPLLPPFLPLGSNVTLELHFDDLNGGFENYAVSFTHCTFDWMPSDLQTNEYIRGFEEFLLDDAEQSFNTRQNYTHYRTTWPNELSQPLVSGNYLLSVYPQGYPEEPILTRRIVVYENKVQFDVRVKESTQMEWQRTHHEVDFTLKHPAYSIFDARRDLEVVILQNHRWDNAITGLKPVFQRGTDLVYDFPKENNFEGLNEFRWFDATDLRVGALGTDSIRDLANGWNFYMTPALHRAYEVYRTDQDLNGSFYIRNAQFDTNLESDYVYVHLSLAMKAEIPGAALHAIGAFNDFRLSPEGRYRWNAKRKRYELTLYLKQGYYNYLIALVTPDRLKGDVAIVEGSHFATENTYTLFAYHFDPLGYYRVVGAAITDSFNR